MHRYRLLFGSVELGDFRPLQSETRSASEKSMSSSLFAAMALLSLSCSAVCFLMLILGQPISIFEPTVAYSSTCRSRRRIDLRPQIQFPGFSRQVLAEAVMLLAAHNLESRLLVNVPGGMKDTLRPERQLVITGAT